MSEIHRADPQLRRKAPWWLLLTTVLGGLLLWWGQRWLNQGFAGDRLQALALLFAGLNVLLATGIGALAWSLWSAAARVLTQDRFPPSDMRTLHDVPVEHGAAARRRAQWLRLCAGVLAVAAIAVTVWGILVLRSLAS